jgi:cation:H+ antiporter
VTDRGPLRASLLSYAASTAVIFIAARYLAVTADELAARSGLGGTFVGTTFVAITTSLPEVVTTIAAVRLGAFDMAVGNIFGSNSFNIATMLPVDVFYRSGSLLSDVSQTHAVTAAAVIIVTGVTTVGLLYRAEKKYWLVEPDAALVAALVAASLVVVYLLR